MFITKEATLNVTMPRKKQIFRSRLEVIGSHLLISIFFLVPQSLLARNSPILFWTISTRFVVVVQLASHVQLFATAETAAHQSSLPQTISQNWWCCRRRRKVSFSVCSIGWGGENVVQGLGRKKLSAPGSVQLPCGSQMPLALPLSALCFVETGNSLGTRDPCIPFLPSLGSPEWTSPRSPPSCWGKNVFLQDVLVVIVCAAHGSQ